MTGDQGNAEASTVNNHVEEWRSDGILRVDYPDGVCERRNGEHPEAVISDGYNQYSIIRQITEFETDKPYAYNNPTTVADAQALLEEAGKTYFPEAQIELMPHWLRAYQGDMKYDRQNDTYSGDPLPQSEGTLMVYFDQIIRDIPVLGCAAQSLRNTGTNSKREAVDVWLSLLRRASKRFGIDELYRSLQFYLVQEKVIAQDVPLCSFQASQEYLRKSDRGRKTQKHFRLGLVISSGRMRVLCLHSCRPGWPKENCSPMRLRKNRRKRRNMIPSPQTGDMLWSNAQTGELIDPWKKGKNRSFDCPDLLTWED